MNCIYYTKSGVMLKNLGPVPKTFYRLPGGKPAIDFKNILLNFTL